MQRRLRLRWSQVVAAVAILPAPGLAAAAPTSAPRTVICVDHAKRLAALSDDDSLTGCTTATQSKERLDMGDVVRVDTGRRLGVRVMNTNTSLFDYDVSEERIAAKDKEALQAFLKMFGPYALDAPSAIAALKQRRSAGVPSTPAEDLKEALSRLDELLDGLHRVEAERANALPRVAADPGGGSRALLARLVDLALVTTSAGGDPGWPDHCRPRWPDLRLAVLQPAGLAGVYRNVADSLDLLLKQTAYDEELVRSARGALADLSGVMDAAYALEALVRRAVNASDEWCWTDGPEVGASHGHKLTLAFAPFGGSEAERLATQEKYELGVEVQPRWLLRPAVGLSLLYSRKSIFPTYEAKETDNGFVPTASGERDARLSYGLTLGLSWRFIERHLKGGWAFWLPELSVNADTDSRGLGVGAGISWKALKIGAGWVWTKHDVLSEGLVADQTILASAGDVKTRSTYAPGKFYVSLSVIGWQPFVSE